MISPSSAVVVVFPFVPVIARIFPFAHWYASSISPMIGIFLSRIAFTIGRSVGTPGLNTTRSSFSITLSGSSPSTISASENAPDFSFTCSSFNSLFPSKMIKSACFFCNNSAAATPLFPVPTIRIFFPVNSMFLPFCFPISKRKQCDHA